MTGIVRGSLDAPPIVLRRRRSWSFLILPVSLAVVSCLVWGVRLGLLDRLGRLLSIWPLMICIPVVALCANQIAHPSVLTLSPEGVTQRRGGSRRKRRWTDIPGLVVSEEGSEEPKDESVELGVESAGAEIIWLDPVIPADQLEALFRAAQARWAPGDVIGPIRQSPNLASLRLGPALAAILVFAASVAIRNHQVRVALGFGGVAWPWWLSVQIALVVLGFLVPLPSRQARSPFVASLISWIGLLLFAAMLVAVAALGFDLWSAAMAALGLTHAQVSLFYSWIAWGLKVIACVVAGLIGFFVLLPIGVFAWNVLTRRRAGAQ